MNTNVRLKLWFLLVQEHKIQQSCKNRFFILLIQILVLKQRYIQIQLLKCLLCILQFYCTHCIYLFKNFRCAILTWNLTTWRTMSRNIFRFINLKKNFLKNYSISSKRMKKTFFFWLCNSKICTRFLSLFLCCWSEYIEFRANIISQW